MSAPRTNLFAAGAILLCIAMYGAAISLPATADDTSTAYRTVREKQGAVEPINDSTHISSASPEDADAVVTKQVGGHTFYIPRGYLSNFLGYGGYFQVHALLPCLAPRTATNASEFDKNTLGNTVVATLSEAGPSDLTGAQLFGVYVADSLYAKVMNPLKRSVDIFGAQIDGTNLFLVRDLFYEDDMYVLAGSNPLFFVSCKVKQKLPFPYFPSCAVREKILGNVLVEYRYDRSFIDSDARNAITIDDRLKTLLEAFSKSSNDASGAASAAAAQGGACK